MEHGHLHQLEKTNNSLRLTSSHSQNLVCCLLQSFMKQYPKQYEHTTKCSALNSLHGCQMSSLCAMSWSVLASAICKICPWSSMSFSTAGWSHHLCGHLPGQLHELHHQHQRLRQLQLQSLPVHSHLHRHGHPLPHLHARQSLLQALLLHFLLPQHQVLRRFQLRPLLLHMHPHGLRALLLSTNACMQAISKCLSTGEPSTDACTDSSPDPV